MEEHLVEEQTFIDDWEYAGVEAIDRACLQVYPDQPNPLQATALVKFWLGGPDPLDYISIYANPGDVDRGIPPHWHYITYGFSDLYGDGRVHMFTGAGHPSGFGFELTFRLKQEEQTDSSPPMWPSNVLNKLANYVFQTGNILQVGDHIPWHRPLNDACQDCVIRHMLITEDPHMPTVETPYGNLNFRQVIGVTEDEVKAAQKWKGAGILELMSSVKEIGPLFITDMNRSRSIFEVEPNLLTFVSDGIECDGSNLGHVTAICMWSNLSPSSDTENSGENTRMMAQSIDNVTSDDNEDSDTLCSPEPLEGVHLQFDAEAAELLPMVVKARLWKGRFFVFHNAENYAIHLIPRECLEEGIFVDEGELLKCQGTFLQIYCKPSLIEKMSQEFEILQDVKEEDQRFPLEFRFSDPTIIITVTPRGMLSCDMYH